MMRTSSPLSLPPSWSMLTVLSFRPSGPSGPGGRRPPFLGSSDDLLLKDGRDMMMVPVVPKLILFSSE